jgi:hypothetical protein
MKKTTKIKPKTRPAKLVITIDRHCKPQNNENEDPPHMSRSGVLGPVKLSFQAVVAADICLPPDFFTRPPDPNPFHVEAGESSKTFTIKSNAPTGELEYTFSCVGAPPCPPLKRKKPDVDGDVIIIDI